MSAHQKPLARFRVIAESLAANEQIPGGTEPKKYGETRYGSRVTMSERMIKTMVSCAQRLHVTTIPSPLRAG